MVLRSYVWWVLSMLSCLAPAMQASEDYLRQYEGRWVGHFTVHSTVSGYSETFPVEQQYWWKAGVLHGVSVMQRAEKITSSRSKTVARDAQFISEVSTGEAVENYWAVQHEGGLVWFSSNLQRTKDYQMKETMGEVDGTRALKTEGFDTYVTGEGLAHLIYRGELKFVE